MPSPRSRRRPQIVAHRGASAEAPENTLAAFRLGFEQGADAIEGDFHLTADGQIVCHHDATTARCGDQNLTIAETTLKELRRVDVGRWKSPKYAGEKIPTLSEVLAVVPRDKGILIELKTGPEIVPFLLPILKAGAVPLSRVLLMSFNALTVRACKHVMPRVRANWLTDFRRVKGRRPSVSPSPAEILATIDLCQADGVGVAAKAEFLTPSLLHRLREKQLRWGAWTVDDLGLARSLSARGAESITTNTPSLFVGETL